MESENMKWRIIVEVERLKKTEEIEQWFDGSVDAVRYYNFCKNMKISVKEPPTYMEFPLNVYRKGELTKAEKLEEERSFMASMH